MAVTEEYSALCTFGLEKHALSHLEGMEVFLPHTERWDSLGGWADWVWIAL